MGAEARVRELGLEIPAYGQATYPGARRSWIRPWRVHRGILYLEGHGPTTADGRVVHPGRLGEAVTVEDGYEAARLTGLNVLGAVRAAMGSLDRAVFLVRSLNFVACAPGWHDVHLVADGLTDLLAEVFGPEAGNGCRATIGVQTMTREICFETWLEFAVED